MLVALAEKGWPRENLILSAIPPQDREFLQPYLELVRLRSGEILYRTADPLTHVHFPVDSAIAKVGVDRHGGTAEYVLLGNEGLVGMNALLGDYRAASHAIVQVPGRCYRVAVPPLAAAFERSALLRRMVLRYVSSRVFQTSQTSLCNARHPIEQRVCRWILQALDRAGVSTLHITHELIGVALGVRREAVTHTALRLQEHGVIRCSRGVIAVPQRALLERVSCECYAALRLDLDLMARDLARL